MPDRSSAQALGRPLLPGIGCSAVYPSSTPGRSLEIAYITINIFNQGYPIERRVASILSAAYPESSGLPDLEVVGSEPGLHRRKAGN